MTAGLTRPRAVLLDWDNTLVDSFPLIHLSTNHTLQAMGHETWSYEKFCRTIASSMRDFFPKLYGDRWREARDIFVASYAKRDLDKIEPLPGAEQLLSALDQAGFYLALVSNKSGHHLRQEVSHLGWDGYFSRVVGAADARADKPDPAVIEFALDGSGIAPGRDVWFVGDNAIDIDCALAAGCVPLIVQGAHASHDVPALDRALRRFRDCHEIAAYVRHITA
jgi:phosphoglycolate phosphatase